MTIQGNYARHRGMIILFGSRTVVSDDGSAGRRMECPSCHRITILRCKRQRDWFTVFFLPVFPICSAKRYGQCSVCGAQFSITVKPHRQRQSAQRQRLNQQAITLYNSLVAAPFNAVALRDLMFTYMAMEEYDQAIGAAGRFPDTLNRSEQCMTLLGRIYLFKRDPASAIAWFDAASARNPNLGDPHHFKALAHLSQRRRMRRRQ